MKKLILIILVCATLGGCATVLSGTKTDCQRTKPAKGEPHRKMRFGYLVLDAILFPPLLLVDFATEAIYKPCKDDK